MLESVPLYYCNTAAIESTVGIEITCNAIVPASKYHILHIRTYILKENIETKNCIYTPQAV